MSRFINPIPQFILSNGDLAAGGTLTFYESGTDIKLPIYSDVNETIQISNPVTLGGRGEVPNVFFTASARCVFADANGDQIFDVDPVNSDQGQGEFEQWNSNIIYEKNDIVFGIDGKIYISIANQNQGNDPTLDAGDNLFWAGVFIPNVWNSNVSYNTNDVVFSAGELFRSLIADNVGNDPQTDLGGNWKSIANAQFVDYDNASSGLVAVTAQGAIDEIINIINNLPSSVIYRGQLDISAGDSALPSNPQNGDLYVIAVAGSITVSVANNAPSLVAVSRGEQIIYNGDTGNWDLIAQVTQASSVSYNNAASGLAAGDVQTAIDLLDAKADTAESNISQNAGDISSLEGRATSLEAFEAQAGTAYTADVQTNQLDTSAGALMAVGAFGLGDTNDLPTWPQTSLNNLTGVGAGIYRAIFGTSDTPDGSNFWVVWYSGFRVASSIQATQIAVRTDNTGVMYFRSSSGGTAANPTWSPWKQVLTVGDFGLGNDGSITPEIANANANLLEATGFYAISSVSANFPSGVISGVLISSVRNVNSAAQLFFQTGSTKTYIRTKQGGVWTSWAELWTSDNLVKTTAYNDNTDLRVPVFRTTGGILGLGNEGNMPSMGDFNGLKPTGFWGTNGGEANSPILSSIVNVLNMRKAGSVQTQFALRASTGSDIRGWIRGTDNGTTYTNWAELWTSENLPISVSGNNVTFPANVNLSDTFRVYWGNSQDFEIRHDGANSYLDNDTGNLFIRNTASGQNVIVRSQNDIRFEEGTGGRYATINSSGIFEGANVRVYSPNNPNVASRYSQNVNRTATRQARVTYEEMRSGNNQTLTIDVSTFGTLDRLVVIKSRTSGTLTIVPDNGTDQFFYPDNSFDSVATIRDGVAATFTFLRINSFQWSVGIMG